MAAINQTDRGAGGGAHEEVKPFTEAHRAMLKEICDEADNVNKPPAMPVYIADFMGSGTVAAMVPAQIGGYFLLCCFCWDNPRLAIPDSDDKLAIMSRLNGQWPESGAAI